MYLYKLAQKGQKKWDTHQKKNGQVSPANK